MPATKVHGVPLGARFKSDDGSVILTVTEFITPSNMTEPWKARVITDTEIPAIIEVDDLKGEGYIRL